MKFFDLNYDFICKELRYSLSEEIIPDLKTQKNNNNQNNLSCEIFEKNYILGSVLKSFASDDEILVYNTLKANGENVQIAYESENWIICSKNVALLARNANDLQAY